MTQSKTVGVSVSSKAKCEEPCYLLVRSMLGVSAIPNTPQTLCTKAFPAIHVTCRPKTAITPVSYESQVIVNVTKGAIRLPTLYKES